MASSDCTRQLGHADFDLSRVSDRHATICPVAGCLAPLERVLFHRAEHGYCAVHGLRLHSGTFVYWNGEGREDDAKLRNFAFRHDLVCAVALGSKGKVESHRLGYETSEDALSWNVFVALADARMLRDVVKWLTGLQVSREPELYLWGERVDVAEGRGARFTPLATIRHRLERGIGQFKTEPDIMLVVDGECVVCIEAKFCSGNPIAHASAAKTGEKPTDRDGLLRRYLDPASERTRSAVDRNRIGGVFHGQLFRNIVFASEMAGEIGANAQWHVVSLMSETQRKRGKNTAEYSFDDPTEAVTAFLTEPNRSRFSFRTWEGIYGALVKPRAELAGLATYFQTKSARYLPAFELV